MDYLQKRLSVGQKRDVRVLKLLLKRAGVYGAEASVGGFSGLLCEYLVLNHRSLYGLISASASWRPPVVIDIEAAYPNTPPLDVSCRFSGAPLVVVDAIDSTRNAAAAVSAYSLAVFSSLSSALLVSRNPKAFFEPRPYAQLSAPKAKALLKKRGTSVEILQVPVPANLVEDVYHPQVRKAAESLAKALQRSGFRLVGWDYHIAGGKACLLFESFDGLLPKLRVVQGPPVWFSAQVKTFVSAHSRVVRGPFILGERVAVEILQDNVSLADELSRLCSSEEVSFGANLKPVFRRVSAVDAFSGAGLELLSSYLSKKCFWLSSK